MLAVTPAAAQAVLPVAGLAEWPAGAAALPADAEAMAAAAAWENGAVRSRGGRRWRQTQNPRSSLNPPHFSKPQPGRAASLAKRVAGP